MLDAVFRIDDLGQADPVSLVNKYHFATGDHRVIDTDIERLPGDAVEFNNAALSEAQKVSYPKRRAANLHRDTHCDVLDQLELNG
jgi:hypothetical protein